MIIMISRACIIHAMQYDINLLAIVLYGKNYFIKIKAL